VVNKVSVSSANTQPARNANEDYRLNRPTQPPTFDLAPSVPADVDGSIQDLVWVIFILDGQKATVVTAIEGVLKVRLLDSGLEIVE